MLSGKEIERGKNGGDTVDMEGVRNSAESSVQLVEHIAVDVSQLVDGVMEHVVLIFEVVGVPICFDLSISRNFIISRFILPFRNPQGRALCPTCPFLNRFFSGLSSTVSSYSK